jgi:hypothetical protein
MEDNELIRIFSEELRETRNLASAAQQHADASMIEARACWAQVDQLRELVIITRNQVTEEIAYMKLPWWKKMVGASPK